MKERIGLDVSTERAIGCWGVVGVDIGTWWVWNWCDGKRSRCMKKKSTRRRERNPETKINNKQRKKTYFST